MRFKKKKILLSQQKQERVKKQILEVSAIVVNKQVSPTSFQRENSLKPRLIFLGLVEYILEMNLDRTQGLKCVLYMNEQRIYWGKKEEKGL